MKLSRIFKQLQKKRLPYLQTDSKQEDLIRQGREQFKSLLRKGLRVPVVLL